MSSKAAIPLHGRLARRRSPASRLLEKLNLQIAPDAVPPGSTPQKPSRWGRLVMTLKCLATKPTRRPAQVEMMRFHAPWPVALSGIAGGITWPEDAPDGKRVIVGNPLNQGQAFLLGDSQFALQKGLTPPSVEGDPVPQNALFWQTTLRSWLRRPAN